MAIETLDDIIDELMNGLGIYGAHDHDNEVDNRECNCRCCRSSSLRSRIIDAVEVERKLARQGTKESPVNAPQRADTAIALWKDAVAHNPILVTMYENSPYFTKFIDAVLARQQ